MSITKEEIQKYVEENIGTYHAKRLENLNNLDLLKIIKRKNPYLFKAKNLSTAPELVKSLLDAFLSSQEESMFGDFLEGLARFINGKIYGGQKSSALGMDLEFNRDDIRYIISIKSGPNWANSQQRLKLEDTFKKAIQILRTSNSRLNIRAIEGCCYGKGKSDKGTYEKICGQRFWELISGMETLYKDIIEPLGYKAKEKNEQYDEVYKKIVNIFTGVFIDEFCKKDGSIDWDKIVEVNSGKKAIRIKLKKPTGEIISVLSKEDSFDNEDEESKES